MQVDGPGAKVGELSILTFMIVVGGIAEDISFILFGSTSTVLTNFLFFFGDSTSTAFPLEVTATRGPADSADLDGAGTECDGAFGEGIAFYIGASSTCLLTSSTCTVEPSKSLLTRQKGSLAGISTTGANRIGSSATNWVKESRHLSQ